MWIFDEKWWPGQFYLTAKFRRDMPGKPWPPTLSTWKVYRNIKADGYGGERYVAAVAGRLAADGKIEGDTLVDLAPKISDGKLTWQVPEGKWKIMRFSHELAPPLGQNGQLSVDGASKDCVDWFLQTVYQPHYDRFKDDFGKTILGFFRRAGDPRRLGHGANPRWPSGKWTGKKPTWPTNSTWPARSRRPQVPVPRFLRRGLGPHDVRRHEPLVPRAWRELVGHFMEHGRTPSRILRRQHDAAAEVQRHRRHRRGLLPVRHRQAITYDAPTWQTPKIASSISHVFGKPNDGRWSKSSAPAGRTSPIRK